MLGFFAIRSDQGFFLISGFSPVTFIGVFLILCQRHASALAFRFGADMRDEFSDLFMYNAIVAINVIAGTAAPFRDLAGMKTTDKGRDRVVLLGVYHHIVNFIFCFQIRRFVNGKG